MPYEWHFELNFLTTNTMELKIKTITAAQTLDLRQRMLRPGRPMKDCIWEDDDAATTTHIGVFDANDLVGISSLYQREPDTFGPGVVFQLRGMAVSETHQHSGVGKKLVEAALQTAREKGGGVLWCNARDSAVGFYQKCGFKISGEPFDLPGIGRHYVMFARL